MAKPNPGEIVYTRMNSDGTAFIEKVLVPVSNYLVACDSCGDLIATQSIGGGVTDAVKVSSVDSTSDYLQAKIQAGPNIYVSKSIDGGGYERLHISSSATGEFDDSHLVTTASFNTWTGSSDSQFAGTASYTKISETASYGLYFSASNHMVVFTGSNDSLGYIDLYGGMLYGTSSWAISASWAPTQVDFSAYLSSSEFNDWTGSTQSQFSGTSSFAASASYSHSGSYVISASWAPQIDYSLVTGSTYPITSSWAVTASYFNQLWLTTGSTYPITSSWAGYSISSISASHASSSISASYAFSASYAPFTDTWLVTGSTYPITSSWAENTKTALTASYISGSIIFSNKQSGYFPQWVDNRLSSTSSLYYSASTLYLDGGIGSLQGTASFAATASYFNQLWLTTGSVYPITSSWSVSSSYAPMPKIKAGIVSGSTFGGTTDLTASVSFTTPFVNSIYSVVVTGEDPRTWYVESKDENGFIINSNSNVVFPGNVYWQAIYMGEYQ